ncbi:MAG: hypothetical protein HY049_08380 [Acidobacteria bacterium]|nr:hypothetical protein [Acidobacteriota bacterium]
MGRIFEDGTLIDAALRQGVEDALRLHKKLGLPVCEWRRGKVVWIPASKIKLRRTRARVPRRSVGRKRSS